MSAPSGEFEKRTEGDFNPQIRPVDGEMLAELVNMSQLNMSSDLNSVVYTGALYTVDKQGGVSLIDQVPTYGFFVPDETQFSKQASEIGEAIKKVMQTDGVVIERFKSKGVESVGIDVSGIEVILGGADKPETIYFDSTGLRSKEAWATSSVVDALAEYAVKYAEGREVRVMLDDWDHRRRDDDSAPTQISCSIGEILEFRKSLR